MNNQKQANWVNDRRLKLINYSGYKEVGMDF